MEPYNDLLIDAINKNDISSIYYCLRKGANVNKTCSAGVTPLIAAVQSGNILILKILAESTKLPADNADVNNAHSSNRSMFLTLDVTKEAKYKNIGYFVVCKDLDEPEFGDGPTPDGMEALEWDMEVNDDPGDEIPSQPESNLYKWYAKILTDTSILLKSPEYDIGGLDRSGRNILHYAVRQGNLEMVEYLLNTFTQINVNVCDSEWCSPIHLAVLIENLSIVKFLVEKGALVNSCNAGRQTPLHFAAKLGNVKIVNYLLDNGANINMFDMDDRSPLSLAVLHEYEDVARILIRKGARLNNEETYGYTILYHAVLNNMYNTTKELLESRAIRHSNFEIVKLLHIGGAIINIRDEQGNTPLMTSCLNNNLQIAKYLLKNGAPANATNHINGMSALHLCVQAIQHCNLFEQFLELLLSYGANINASSYQGNILFYAIILGNIPAACILVKHGADVNLRDEHAYFDNLCLAKKHGNFDLVKLIVLAGFNFSNMLFDLKTLRSQNEDVIFDFLVYMTNHPRNLRDLCRIRIRKQ
ncbi:Ankyrin repeats (3 copies) [Popillia japonica]|uniref:Ankyrin repeats (3 copies) n=1 Tax=Popillia japonica TaxID=7064 RepID=A0AAW1MEZ8_POPJA